MKQPPLPPEHHIIRHVPWTKLRKDADDNVIGVLAEAFRRREDEAELSVTWREYFSGASEEQLRRAVTAFRRTMNAGRKSRFAVGNVGRTHAAAKSCGVKIRIVHEPEDKNPGHATIRRLPRDNEPLLTLLAEEVFLDLHVSGDLAPLD